MIAVDDRQSVDAPADRGISGARLGRGGAAAVDVEQRGDDLEVVLHAVMDLADQPPLAVERLGHLPLRFLDALDRALEGVAELADFRRRARGRSGSSSALVTGLVGEHRALQAAQRADQQAPLTSNQLSRAATTHISTGSSSDQLVEDRSSGRRRWPIRRCSWPLADRMRLGAAAAASAPGCRLDDPQLGVPSLIASVVNVLADVGGAPRAGLCDMQRRRSPCRRSRRRG